MTPLEKHTAYLLLKATTNSQWDVCDFALISISQDWKKNLEKRLSNLTPFVEDPMFISMSFYDLGVEFYKNSNETLPISTELLDNRDSMLISVDEQLIESLSIPENCLDCHELVIYANGTACYKAYSKHTGEEFWTIGFSIKEIQEPLNTKNIEP